MPEKQLLIIIDTNIWRSSVMLRTPLSAVLLHVIKSSDGRIGLPEVVELEILKHLPKLAEDAVDYINKGFRQIEMVMGWRSKYEVPNSQQILKAVEGRLAKLDEMLLRMPISLEHVRGALQRVNEGTPPNGPKNQQFKDSLIWEEALEAARSYKVHVVTNDSGFFKDQSKTAIADFLLAECRKLKVDVQLHSDLNRCLEALKAEEKPIDKSKAVEVISEVLKEKISDYASDNEISIGQPVDHDLKVYVTERLGCLSISFEITFEGFEMGNDIGGRSNIKIKARGSVAYLPDEGKAANLDLSEIEYKWRDVSGENQESRHTFSSATIRIGGAEPPVLYSIREQLNP